jgi:hypothetical protein
MISRIGGQRHAGTVDRRTGTQHVSAGHRQGFFAKNVFPRLGCRHDLVGVQRVRGAQHHALDLRVCKDILETSRAWQASLLRERLTRGPDVRHANHLQLGTVGEHIDDDAPPPSQPDHGNFQHRRLPHRLDPPAKGFI